MNADICGCCETPGRDAGAGRCNRPGLTAIAYRVGTYASFRHAMLQRHRAPAELWRRSRRAATTTTRSRSLEMWATVADVLTFYQERIANEGVPAHGAPARFGAAAGAAARLPTAPGRRGHARCWLSPWISDASARDPHRPARAERAGRGREAADLRDARIHRRRRRLNSLRVLPVPEGSNPLARGSTAGILAPGADGLAIARLVAPNTRLVLFDTAGAIELLAVRELRVEEERATLSWSGPVQGTNWNIRSELYLFDRTFRIFGCDAPAQYVEPVLVSGKVDWQMRTFASFAYAPSANVIELDGKYENLAVGTRLLISVPGASASNTLATVLAVGQAQATFKPTGATTSPVSDTVTWVKLSNLPPGIPDRRSVLLYEVTSPRVRFWGYRYPESVSGSTLLCPRDASIVRPLKSAQSSRTTR